MTVVERVEREVSSPANTALTRVVDLLQREGLAVAVLRDASRDGRGALEADLLVDPAQRDQVEAVLVADGFRRRPGWGRDPHRFFLRPLLDEGSVDWLKLDVVTDLCFGVRHEWPTRLGAACLADRRTDVARLAPADELVAHVLHALVDRRSLRTTDAAALTRRAAEVEGGGRLALALTRPGVGPASFTGLVAAAREGRWESVRAARPALRRTVALRHPVEGVRRRATSAVLRRGTRLLRPLSGPGGVVALVGPDGTGKSTLVAGLRDEVGVQTRALYGGTYRSGARSSVPGAATARVLGRLLATRVALGWNRRMGRLVILDRHPAQARPLAMDALTRRSRLRRRLLASTLPDPDLLLVLDAPADVLHARRPEHDPAHLDRDRARHAALRMAVPTHIVDATAAPEVVRARAVELIWCHAVPSGVPAR